MRWGALTTQRLIVFLLVMYGLALVAGASSLREAIGDDQPPAADIVGNRQMPPPAAKGIKIETGQQPEIPTLSDADAVIARLLLSEDRSFQAIVAGRPYTITRMGPWTTSNGPWKEKDRRLELLGAAMVVAFAAPIAIEGTKLPMVLYDVTEANRQKPFQEVTNEVQAERVRELHVLVDLRQRKVINISPGVGSSVQDIKYPRGFRRTVPGLSNDAPGRPSGPPGVEPREP